MPWAFFDGACQNNFCGLGFTLHLTKHFWYTFKGHVGVGSNNKAELLALLFLLRVAWHKINSSAFSEGRLHVGY